jgi:hypothetical protein
MPGKLLKLKGSENESSKAKTFYSEPEPCAFDVSLLVSLLRSPYRFINFSRFDLLIKSLDSSRMPLIEPYFFSIF